MKASKSVFITFSICLLFCSQVTFAQQKGVEITGSWELISYLEPGQKTWKSYPPEIIYQKHITGTHFIWIKYDTKNDKLIGLGGGTYELDKSGKYLENIEFFYPPGSSELGQTIPFDVQFKKGMWLHTGYAKQTGFNENGEVEMVDSIKIEEKWSPMLPKVNNSKQLVGTWNLEAFRNSSDEPYVEYPEFTGYLKLITTTHFIWVRFDKEDDQIFSAGGGQYTFTNGKYIENLEVSHPSNSVVKQKSILFKPEISGNKWIHKSRIDSTKPADKENLIDEIWVPYKSIVKDYSFTDR